MSSATLRPGIVLGRYPERRDARASWLERVTNTIFAKVQRRRRARSTYMDSVCKLIDQHSATYTNLNEGELSDAVLQLRRALVGEKHSDDLVAKVFALIREKSGRVLGMRHFDCQLIGGWVIFNGMLAEMDTGEGKTLTASLPAATAALAGIPVHVVTVNDYLAARDAELMRPLYIALGLSVGVIVEDSTQDDRKAAYACDITYITNKQLTFDYLKDRLVIGRASGRIQLQVDRLDHEGTRHNELLLRGLCFAIVDEADSVLIDEARTPLILSRQADGEEENQMFIEGLDIATQLCAGTDFLVETRERRISLTDSGEGRLAQLAEPLGTFWRATRRRKETIVQALSALHLFHRDKHYLVRDDAVQIIDEYTGRVMPDRCWERGLHQFVQAKERVEISGRNETLAKISYQRFFRRYLRLGGMSGTAYEVAGELSAVYGLNVVPIPTHKPPRRAVHRDQVFVTSDEKWDAVITEILRCRASGQPVLVGTRTVQESEQLGASLAAQRIEHEVLNARQDAHEAEIVGRAGGVGRVTVATNIAGRGTDIPVSEEAKLKGGLHVILTERHEAGRIDRQLIGRCARQGDPGSAVSVLSIEDALVALYYPASLRWSVNCATTRGKPLPTWAGSRPIRIAQSLIEKRHARIRADLFKHDQQLTDQMAFAGRPE